MTDLNDTAFRRFPNPGWAWPSGHLDRLICAAIHRRQDVALNAFRVWLGDKNIDDADFSEQRLLAAIAHRFGRDIAAFPQYKNLVNLQRILWSKSSMAVAETAPVLRTLAGAGINAMLIKGGARIAVRPDDQLARVSYDIDILVSPESFGEVAKTLFDAGWRASTGESRYRVVAHGSDIRAMNFFKGQFGDIDLHQWAYGISAPVTNLETALWHSSQSAEFNGIPVLVPSPTDRIAMAIYHSGLEAHTHSDWLVDCAQLLCDDDVDWHRLADTIESAKVIVPARVALSYLNQQMGYALPSDFMTRLFTVDRNGGLTQISSILQAKPRADWTPATRLARGIAKQIGIAREAAVRRGAPLQKGRIVGRPAKTRPMQLNAQQRIHLQTVTVKRDGYHRFVLDLEVNLPGVPRRIEFELNTDMRHVLGLQVRSLTRRNGLAQMRFKGALKLRAEDRNLWLEARPGRHLRGSEQQSTVDRYGQLEASVLSFKLK